MALVSPFLKDVGGHGNISQSGETDCQRGQRDGFIKKSGEISVRKQQKREVDALHRSVMALLERGYSSVGLGTVCLDSRPSGQ